MHVIFNRLHAGRFGRTIADVCLARYQFSEWLDDAGDSANLRRGARAAADDPVMKDCLAAFDEVATGGKPDPTRNSTHYHDRSIAPPAWAQPPSAVTLSTQHCIFYRGVTYIGWCVTPNVAGPKRAARRPHRT